MIDVDRPPEPPPSLARGTSWRGRDVHRALHEAFLGKCYLCEGTRPLGECQIEHRRPRNKFPELCFEWANLYPACGRCNNARPDYPNEGELLNPGEGVETRIEQVVDYKKDPIQYEFKPLDSEDHAAEHTCRELRHLHNPKASRSWVARQRTSTLLSAIRERYHKDVYPVTCEVEQLRRGRRAGQAVAVPLERAENQLRKLVSRRAPYTMLIRSLVGPHLADLFD